MILAEQIIQQQLEKIGVKLTIKNSPDILDTKMVGFDYETMIFAWVGGPDPYTGNVIWLSSAIPEQCAKRLAKADECDYSGQNYTKVEGPAGRSNFSTPPTRKPIPRCGRSCTTRPTASWRERRHRGPAVPEAHAARLPEHDHGRCRTTPPQDGFTWNIEDWTYTRDSPSR